MHHNDITLEVRGWLFFSFAIRMTFEIHDIRAEVLAFIIKSKNVSRTRGNPVNKINSMTSSTKYMAGNK